MLYDTNNLFIGDVVERQIRMGSVHEYIINNVLLYMITEGVYLDFSRADLYDDDYNRKYQINEELDKLIKYFKHPEKYKSFGIVLNKNYIINEFVVDEGSTIVKDLKRLNVGSGIVDFDKLINIYEEFSCNPINQPINTNK